MKIFLKVCLIINMLMLFGTILGFSVYFIESETFVFGTEVSGFSYRSKMHYIVTNLFFIVTFTLGICSFFIQKIHNVVGVGTVFVGVVLVIFG